MLPAKSEVIVTGKVYTPSEKQIPCEMLIVEGVESFLKRDTALVGRTLVGNRPLLPVRIMNLTDEEQKIYQGTTIGQVFVVQAVLDDKRCQDTENNVKVRKDLEDLLSASKANLT